MRKRNVVHWLLRMRLLNSGKAFCGKNIVTCTAVDKELVTCEACKKLMVLHDHLPDPSLQDYRAPEPVAMKRKKRRR
jgi:hypothetical protein